MTTLTFLTLAIIWFLVFFGSAFLYDKMTNKRRKKNHDYDENVFFGFRSHFTKRDVYEDVYVFDSTKGDGVVSVSSQKDGECLFKFKDLDYVRRCEYWFSEICDKLKSIYHNDFFVCDAFDFRNDKTFGKVWFKRFRDVSLLFSELIGADTNYFTISETDGKFYRFSSHKYNGLNVGCPKWCHLVDVMIERYTKDGEFYILNGENEDGGLTKFTFVRKNFSKD